MITFQQEALSPPYLMEFAALTMLLLGLFTTIHGGKFAKRTSLPNSYKAIWLRQVRGLARGVQPSEHSEASLLAAQRQWLAQMGAATRAAGIGVLVGGVVSCIVALLALRLPFSLPFALFWLLCLPPFWGLTIGFVCGSILAGRRHPALGDDDEVVAQPTLSRKVSDYRSPALPIIMALFALAYTVLTILLAPHYMPFYAFDLQRYALISPPHWILVLYPCAFFLTAIVVEGCAQVRVKAQGGITSADAVLARNLSMALIGFDLSRIYYLGFLMGWIGIGVTPLLSPTLLTLSLDALDFITSFVPLLWLGIGASLLQSEGRLGGRLTGWPWRNGAAREG